MTSSWISVLTFAVALLGVTSLIASMRKDNVALVVLSGGVATFSLVATIGLTVLPDS